ncbi:hypothetical protein EGW08_016144, partial [Elysia chlorotica]
MPGPTEDTNSTMPGPTDNTNSTMPGPTDNTNSTKPGSTDDTNSTMPGPTEDTNSTMPGPTDNTNSTKPGSTEDTNSTMPGPTEGGTAQTDSATNSTDGPNETEASVTPVSTTQTPAGTSTAKPQNLDARISETNLLLAGADEADSLFIELTGGAGQSLAGVWLVVRDAGPGAVLQLSLKLDAWAADNATGLCVLDSSSGLALAQLATAQAVFVGLYAAEPADSLTLTDVLDALLYSTSDTALDQSLAETFGPVTRFPLTLDHSQLAGLGEQSLSLSRCPRASGDKSNAAFLLAHSSPGNENGCAMPNSHPEEMWLSIRKQPCPDRLPESF